MTTTLIITSNPEPNSLTASVGKAFANGIQQNGGMAEILDLYEIGFNPVYSLEDRKHYLGQAPMPKDVNDIQNKLASADIITLVFPVYWYSMPAMMKGFFDRVICKGFAYEQGSGERGVLSGKKVRVILLTGGGKYWYESDGIGEALNNQIGRQTFQKYCGVEDVELLYVDNLSMGDNDPDKRQAVAKQLDDITNQAAALV
jgi:NAD(P)H dehydrogenase (quinone)